MKLYQRTRRNPTRIERGGVCRGDPCDLSDVDKEDMVKTILRGLPSHHTQSNSHAQEVVSGFFVGPNEYKDMDKLETFTPVVGFCRDGLKLMQVDLVNTKGPLLLVIPWRTCGGKNGTIEVYFKARVTVTFKVADPTVITKQTLKESPMIHPDVPLPVFVDVVAFGLKGAGDVLGTVASVLGRLFQGLVKELGEEMVTYRLRDVLNEIGRT
ncbi:hypothetical protein HPB48_000192 [Haemaphysalis longicornis]|uniref:Uncharacterized protein n=1 Tax=Haemaphysalis longicornis TaxID=44386 RepID=A0A9J6GK13_HAELO|nr:hypothetical protein HPB48_000192 [Haemaphysalis longicornis]